MKFTAIYRINVNRQVRRSAANSLQKKSSKTCRGASDELQICGKGIAQHLWMFKTDGNLNGLFRDCLGKSHEAGFKAVWCRQEAAVEKCPRRSKNNARGC